MKRTKWIMGLLVCCFFIALFAGKSNKENCDIFNKAVVCIAEENIKQAISAEEKATEIITEEIASTEEITTEDLNVTTKENPLQFGEHIDITDTYQLGDYYFSNIEYDIAITGYSNSCINCEITLLNSGDMAEVWFDSNFNIFFICDENFNELEYASPITLDGITQGDYNKLTVGLPYNGEIGSLRGQYGESVPKYIGIRYGWVDGQYGEPLIAYYEIPEGLFDTSYINLSVLGASSAEEAHELFIEAVNNEGKGEVNYDLLKKISLVYYACYYMPGRVLLEEMSTEDYLGVDVTMFQDMYGYDEPITDLEGLISERGIIREVCEIRVLNYMEEELYEDCNCSVRIQAGYVYLYGYENQDSYGTYGEYIFMINDKWYVGWLGEIR